MREASFISSLMGHAQHIDAATVRFTMHIDGSLDGQINLKSEYTRELERAERERAGTCAALVVRARFLVTSAQRRGSKFVREGALFASRAGLRVAKVRHTSSWQKPPWCKMTNFDQSHEAERLGGHAGFCARVEVHAGTTIPEPAPTVERNLAGLGSMAST